MFEADPLTEAIVIFGEIGSSQEEELAQLIRDRKVTKPVIAYIGGKAAREGTRFSHAGAIIEGGRGTHAGKVKALREAGATVVDAFGELPGAVVEILKRMKGQSLMSEADKKAVWNTAITRIEPNRVAVRGYDIADLMGRVSFGAAVYLILTGELPTPADRALDGCDIGSVDRSRRHAAERAGRANRCIHRRVVKRLGRGRHHVDQSSSRRRDRRLRAAIEKDRRSRQRANPFPWMKPPRARSRP